MKVLAGILSLGSLGLAYGDHGRECLIDTCHAATEATMGDLATYSCKSVHKVVADIAFAQVTIGDGCILADNETTKDQLFALRACDAARDLVMTECEGMGSCAVDLRPAMASCGVTLNETLSVEIKCGEAADVLEILTYILLLVVGLGLGASLDFAAIRRVFGQLRRAFLVGFTSQLLVMPLVGFLLAKLLHLEHMVAVGIIIIASCPGGLSSNLFTYYVHGNVALSISMSAISTMASFVTLPFLIWLYGHVGLGLSNSTISIPFGNIAIGLLMAVLPAGVGLMIRWKSKSVAHYVEKGGSIIGLLLLIAVFGYAISRDTQLLQASKFPKVWVAAFLFQPIGSLMGYTLARYVARLKGPEARAISLETGIQNIGLCLALISTSFSGCARTAALTVPLTIGMAWFVNSFIILIILRYLAMHDHLDADEEEDLERHGDENKQISDNYDSTPPVVRGGGKSKPKIGSSGSLNQASIDQFEIERPMEQRDSFRLNVT